MAPATKRNQILIALLVPPPVNAVMHVQFAICSATHPASEGVALKDAGAKSLPVRGLEVFGVGPGAVGHVWVPTSGNISTS